MDKGIIFIGMDLGTFKTSVASSTGVRDVVPTAVGWPKDHVARTMLGRDVVFGKDLTEHRLALHVVRPFEKGVLKYNGRQGRRRQRRPGRRSTSRRRGCSSSTPSR